MKWSAQNFITTVCILVVTVGFAVILGWVMDIPALTSLVPGFPTMKFNTAVCLILAGSALYLQSLPKPLTKLIKILSFTCHLIAGITVVEWVTGIDLGLDVLLMPKSIAETIPTTRMRMAESTAFCLFWLGLGLVLVRSKNYYARLMAQWMFHFITLTTFIATVGYILNVPEFYQMRIFAIMAINSAISLLLLSIAASLLNPKLGFIGILTGNELGNNIARKYSFRVLIVVICLAYIRIVSHKADFVNVEFGIALFGLSFMLLWLVLIWRISHTINVLDRNRTKANSSFERIERFLDSTPDGLLIVDNKGIIRLKNQQTELLFEYEGDSLIGKQFDILLPNTSDVEMRKRIDKYFKAVLHQTEKTTLVTRGLTRTGTLFPVEISFNLIELEDETLIAASIRDISDRLAMEANIKRTRERLELATLHTNVGIWEYDVAQNSVTWEQVMYALYNVSQNEFDGTYNAWLSLIHREDRVVVAEAVQKAWDEKTEFDQTFRVQYADSSLHYIRAKATVYETDDGKPPRMLGTSWDVTHEKKGEIALALSNKQNLAFVQQAPSAIAMFDTEMRYIAVSKKWLSDYNIAEEEIIGKSHYEIFPEIDENWKAIHRECLQGAINTSEDEPFERADGSTQWISWDVRPWYNSEGAIGGIVMSTSNRTQYKESVQERLRVEQILNSANAVTKVGTWEVDLVKDTIHWSRITREIYEVDQDYVPNMATAIAFYKEGRSRELLRSAIQAGIEQGTPWDLELELVTQRGREIWTRSVGHAEYSNGVCKRLFGIFQDIDEKKQNEVSLNKANEELKAIFNSDYVSIIGTDTTGIITHFNKGAERILCYSSEEVIGKFTPVLFHIQQEIEDRGNHLSEQYRKDVRGFDVFVEEAKHKEYDSHEWTYVRKNGTQLPVQLVVTAMRDTKQNITGFLGIAVDISEVKRAHDEIHKLLEITTEQNQRLKSFAHIVSHNLRSHSGNFAMLLDILKKSNEEFASDEIFSMLVSASDSLKETIGHLNDVVVMNLSINQNLVPISLYDAYLIAESSINVLATNENVRIYNELHRDTLILGVPAYVESILLNLLTNGIKYRSRERESYIRISDEIVDKSVVVTVVDNGVGIDLERYGSKLFGMYKTFHGNEDARGIGLFLTKNQIESLGGTIHVESVVNVGTTFKISLQHG